MENLGHLGYHDYCITIDGRVYSLKRKKFMKIQYNDIGYKVVTFRVNDKTKTVKVHRLIGLTYLKESYFDGAIINHKDGNKGNNDLNNLEWVTRSENVLHAYTLGLIAGKPRQITDEVVHDICQLLESGARVCDVSKMFNIDINVLHNIKNRKAYHYISYEYDFSEVPKQQKISTEKIIKVCELISSGYPLRETSELSEVHISTVKNIKGRRTHTHISSSYNW